MKFNDTITVYNVIPQVGRTPQRLKRTVVHGVFWNAEYGAGFEKGGKRSHDDVMVMIPDSPRIVPVWELGEGDNFTLIPGDIIARGERGEYDSPADIPCEKITITGVRDCRFGSKNLWHWEVTGK